MLSFNISIILLPSFEEKNINLSTFNPNIEAEIAMMIGYTINQMSRGPFWRLQHTIYKLSYKKFYYARNDSFRSFQHYLWNFLKVLICWCFVVIWEICFCHWVKVILGPLDNFTRSCIDYQKLIDLPLTIYATCNYFKPVVKSNLQLWNLYSRHNYNKVLLHYR